MTAWLAEPVEEHAHQLADGFLLRGGPRCHRGIDVAQAFGAVLDHALGFELGEHRPRRRIARRVAQLFADLLRRGGVAKGIEDIHDFPFTPAEFEIHVTCYDCSIVLQT